MTVQSSGYSVGRALTRWAAGAAALVFAGLFACSGDGGTEPVTLDLGRSTLTVAAGPYVAGQTYTATFTARDNTGAPYDTPVTVAFDLVGGVSDGIFSGVTSGGPGIYQASFEATVAGTASQLTVAINGTPLTGALPTVTVVPGAASVAQSTVALAATTLAVGATTTATVTVRDARGNVRSAGGDVVLFTKGTGTSDGTFTATTDNGNGTYSATFTATVQGTPLPVSATVNGQALTSTPASVTVTAPAPSLAQSTVAVAASTIASGSATTLTLTTRSAAGVPLTTTGLTVVFTKGAGTSDGTISAVTDNGNGTYSATITGTTAGTPRAISATIGGAALTSAAPTLTVTPGPASVNSTVTVGAATVGVGAATTLTLTARDAAGNNLTAGGATVLFTKGAGTSDGTISAVTDNTNGTYTATFTATTVGTARSIGATVGGVAVTTAAPTITVQPGAFSLAQSTVTVASAALAAGAQTTLTLTVRDAGGNVLPGGGLAVAFTKGSGSSDGNISAVTDNNNGTYSATFTATTAGTARVIGATIGGAAVTSAAPSITVSPGAVSAATSTVTVGAAQVTSGASTTLTFTARDAGGNALTSGGLTVAFTKGNGGSDGNISAVTDNNNGTYTATFTGTTAGTARALSATVGGVALTSAAPTITVTPGAISLAQSTVAVGTGTLSSGSTTSLTLITRDAAGNLRNSGGSVVLFTKGSGSSDGGISAVTDNNDGTYSATFTATTAGTARAIGATIGGAAVTSAAPTITVTAGVASLATSTVTVGTSSVVSGAATTLTLTMRDAAGNAIGSGGLVVTFTKGSGTSDGTIGAVVDNNNGTYSATFTGTTAGTARSIGATVGGNAVTSASPNIVVTPGAASTASTVSVSANSVANGGNVTLTLNARDLAGNVVTTGGATVVFTRGPGTSDGTISATTDNGNGSYTATFTATVAGTPRQIGATVNGAAVTTVLPGVLVLPPPTMALGADTVHINVQLNTLSSTQLITVANIGSGSIAGLATSNVSLPGGAPQCASVNWLVAPTFDQGGVAAPLSLMSLQANATGLALGTCARSVTVTSTTPGVASRQVVVVANVGRNPVAEGAVRVVMMGNASDNSVQVIAPTPVLTIDNGGRGVISGVTATVVSTTGYAECTDPFDTDTCVPWLTNADLLLSSTTLPTTLSIISQVRPFSASAVIRVQGNGMAAREFPVSVLFNIEPELVTNARNILLKGRVGGANVADTVVALNQNVANGGLTNYRVDPAGPAVPSWMSFAFTPTGNSANVVVTANLAGFTRDTVIVDTIGVRLIADCTDPGDCFSGPSKTFNLAYALVVERGLVSALSNVGLFAPVSGGAVTQDVQFTNSGAGELSGLGVSIAGGAPWLSAAFVGGSTTPATLRLTANPTGLAAGQYNTTVTVSVGAGASLQQRTLPVRLTVY